MYIQYMYIMLTITVLNTGNYRLYVIYFNIYVYSRVIWTHNDSNNLCLKLNIQKMKIMASGPIPVQMLFSWAPKSLWMVTSAMKLKDAFSSEEKL